MLKLNLDIKETDAKGEKWHDAPWTGKFVKKYQMHFKSGSTKPQVGETLTGASSGTTAKVASVSVCSGSWTNGDAAGTITFTSAGSDEFEGGEQINGSVGGNNILTCVSSVYAGYGLLHPQSFIIGIIASVMRAIWILTFQKPREERRNYERFNS